MSVAASPIVPGSRVIRSDGSDFRALTVTAGNPRYISAADPVAGGECAAPASCFLALPNDWQDPPARHISEIRAVESAYSGPIPPGMLAAAEARDATLPALIRKLDAAEAWLAWVQAHLHPLSPAQFEPHLLAARSAREAALQGWLRAAGPGEPEIPAIAAE